jgi:hypothetical protein
VTADPGCARLEDGAKRNAIDCFTFQSLLAGPAFMGRDGFAPKSPCSIRRSPPKPKPAEASAKSFLTFCPAERLRDWLAGMYNGRMKLFNIDININMSLRLSFAIAAVLAVAAGCTGPGQSELGATPLRIPFQNSNWDAGENVGRELTSTHYRIYTTSTRPEIIDYLPGFMEAAHRNYLAVTDLKASPPAEPMNVYMMASRQEWAGLTRSIVGGQWDVYASISAGGYCYKGVCVFWDIGGLASLSIASHEGLHQFLHHRVKEHLPMWMEEGLATLAEGYDVDGPTVRFTPERNITRFTDLRKAMVNDWWIPLEKLLQMDGGDAVQLGAPERAVGYYGQLWALAQFLRTDPQFAAGRQRLIADADAGKLVAALGRTDQLMARQLGGTRSYNRQVALPLFRRYISDDLQGFEARYKAFARKLARLQ